MSKLRGLGSGTSPPVGGGLLVVGCDGSDRHMKRKVMTSEIVGIWKMTAASLQLLKRDGYVASPGETQTITFNADGSQLISGSSDRRAWLWDAETGTLLARSPDTIEGGHINTVAGVAINPVNGLTT